MINNLEQILPLLEFKENWVYELLILQRKKDNPHLVNNSNVRTIKVYNIRSKEYLEKKMDEIIKLCELFNARAYIKLGPIDTSKLGYEIIKYTIEKMKNKDYDFSHILNKAQGNITSVKKRWIVDIDEIEYVDRIIAAIPKEAYICTIPTKNGVHVITSPFRIDEFASHQDIYYKCEIKKSNPTLLYCK